MTLVQPSYTTIYKFFVSSDYFLTFNSPDVFCFSSIFNIFWSRKSVSHRESGCNSPCIAQIIWALSKVFFSHTLLHYLGGALFCLKNNNLTFNPFYNKCSTSKWKLILAISFYMIFIAYTYSNTTAATMFLSKVYSRIVYSSKNWNQRILLADT